MNKKQVLITMAVVAALGALAYLQFRSWQNFAWKTFFARTAEADKLKLATGVALIYVGYLFRSWRWKMFLRPTKDVAAGSLLSPMLIGFTGLAVLGRPGDLIRPYLIARKVELPFTSQIAVLTVERLTDMGTVATMLAVDLLFSPHLRELPYYREFEFAGIALVVVVLIVATVLFLIWRNSEGAAAVVHRLLDKIAPNAARAVANKIAIFGEGLHTIHDVSSLAQIVGSSMVLWICIGLSYLMVTHAYPDPALQSMTLSQAVLLMSASVAGSLLQLPMVGGGSQLGTIAVLRHVFLVEENVAASAGIMLWLITFMAVIPLGLLLARREHVSLAKLSEESHEAGLRR
ncbi:MAG TPA: lysylphosphatidylglycerol synthase transmembrane domain-containing protein [Terriglobales bacterium]|nr:lysylphosphatidylglycerol synthase transmembrane domain-containing protein [Terriglobales bacterium]